MFSQLTSSGRLFQTSEFTQNSASPETFNTDHTRRSGFLQIWRQVLTCHAPEVCVVEEKQATNHACSNRGEDEHKPLLKQRRTWLGKSTFIEGCLHNTCDVIYDNVHYTVFHKE